MSDQPLTLNDALEIVSSNWQVAISRESYHSWALCFHLCADMADISIDDETQLTFDWLAQIALIRTQERLS